MTNTMDKCIGALISVNCGSEGIYQGKLVSLDAENKNVTLSNAFKDGRPVGVGKTVVLNGSQIQALKVLKTVVESNKQSPLPRVPPLQCPTTTDTLSQTASHSAQSTSQKDCSDDFASSPRRHQKHTRAGERRKKVELTSTEESDTSSGDVSPALAHRYSHQRMQRAKSKSFSKSAHNDPDTKGNVPEIAPTPLYRKYEPQVPCPQHQLPSTNGFVNGQGQGSGRGKQVKTRGPCGIPALDALGVYGRIQGRNNDLSKPIDFKLLDTDFDFEGNLELFKKEVEGEDDNNYFEEVELPKMSKNFAHYENIVNDPTRITSWTNILGKEEAAQKVENTSTSSGDASNTVTNSQNGHSLSFSAIHFESTSDGRRIPVLASDNKKKLLKQAERFLGSDVFNSVCADRVFAYFSDICRRYNIKPSSVCVIGSDGTAHQLIDRFLMHLSNRNVNSVIYGCEPSEQLSSVKYADRIDKLPDECKIAVCMDGDSSCDPIIDWLLAKKAHVITLESDRQRLPEDKRHILHLVTLTEGLTSSSRAPSLTIGRTSFAALAAAVSGSPVKVDSAVADIAVPYKLFTADCSFALADLFATQLLVTV